MRIPIPRGDLSSHVFQALGRPPGDVSLQWVEPDGVEDEQIALWTIQQLSYRRIEGVDPAWEEAPTFLSLRSKLERHLEADLRDTVPAVECPPEQVPEALEELVDGTEGPSLSMWMSQYGTTAHLREFVVHRAAYQLQEADPHSFAIPRIEASICKTALLEMQLDEYGGHEPTEAHALLFARTMEALGLSPVADVDRLPATTLATNTLLNWLGRSRRLVPACLGHLAVFEMSSVESMARYAATVRRVLPPQAATKAARFYDVHVAADGLHGAVAIDRLISGFVTDHPDEAGDVLFGAAAVLHVERRFAAHLIASWERSATSLRAPLAGPEPVPRTLVAVAS